MHTMIEFFFSEFSTFVKLIHRLNFLWQIEITCLFTVADRSVFLLNNLQRHVLEMLRYLISADLCFKIIATESL